MGVLIMKRRPRELEFIQMPLKNNMTETFLHDLEWRVRNQKNFNIFIDGEQGTGKSTIAREIKAYCDNLFKIKGDINDICMDRREFLERFKLSKPFWTLIIDEDFAFRTQVGSTRVSEQFEFVEQSIRIEQTNIISCSIATQPHLFNYKLKAFDIDYEM